MDAGNGEVGRHELIDDGIDASIRLSDTERSAYRRHLVKVAAAVVMVALLLGARIGLGIIETRRAYAHANPVDVAAARACKPFFTDFSGGDFSTLDTGVAADRVNAAALSGRWVPLSSQIDTAVDDIVRLDTADTTADANSDPEAVALDQVTEVLKTCETVPVDAQGHVGGY